MGYSRRRWRQLSLYAAAAILAIDTSNQTAGLALMQAGSVLEEWTWRSDQNHTTELAPAVHRVLQRHGLEPGAIQAVTVAVGPGSFNGLRAGISLAKGFAGALGIPVVGVSTLESLAYQQARFRGLVRPMLPAGRGQWATGLFRWHRGRFRRLEADRLASMDEVLAATEHRTMFCGEIGAAESERLHVELGRRAVIASPAGSFRRPGFLAELAWQRLQHSPGDEPVALQASYLRRPSIGGVSQV